MNISKTLHTIPVFYTEKQVANSQSFSPSAHKPKEVVESWQRLGIPLDIREPLRLTREVLALAHDWRYVEGVLEGRLVNGFGNTSPQVAASLPYTSGSLLSAATEALRNGHVAVSPTSGFHHAGYAQGGGFCTFNGLIVTARCLRETGQLAKGRIGILDCDHHYGDGSNDIIDRINARRWISHLSVGSLFHRAEHAEYFLSVLPNWIEEHFSDCDLILYQAGADPHIDDPLGGWLTTDQLLRRDTTAFETARRLGIPVAWNLAGGYQEPLRKVLDIHDNTLLACAAVYGVQAQASAPAATESNRDDS